MDLQLKGRSALVTGGSRGIVMKLHDAVVKTMATPEVREKFINVGADPLIMSPEEFTQFIRKDIEKWAKVAKAANVKMDQ